MKGKVLAEEKADRIQGKSFQKPMDFVEIHIKIKSNRKGDAEMIYLDNAATMRKPPQVVQAVVKALESIGNAGRGAYHASLDASRIIYDTRVKLVEFLAETMRSRSRLLQIQQQKKPESCHQRTLFIRRSYYHNGTGT